MEYLDFELEISPGSGREYPVAVVRSPAGEARVTMHFPFGELELENKLQALQIALLRSGGKRRLALSSEQQAVQEFGQALFDALLVGEVRGRYDVSWREADQQGKGLRLKLRIRSPELAALPWEFMHDARYGSYVCLSKITPMVRYLELPRSIRPFSVRPPLRILGMVVSPRDRGALNVALEKQRVEKAIEGLQADGMVALSWLEGQTWRDLQRAMRRGEWHIFHFVGHGGYDRAADEGVIVLADEEGNAYSLRATQLGMLLADHRSLRLALLNACEGARGGTQDILSSTASILVQQGVPAVLAMQYEITDRAAIEMARAFYEALADGSPVDEAVTEARKAISLAVANSVEWGTPVLYMRAPDGVLFRLEKREGEEAGGAVAAPGGIIVTGPVYGGIHQQSGGVSIEGQHVTAGDVTGHDKVTAAGGDVLGRGAVRKVETSQPFEPELVLIPAGEFLMGSDPAKDKQAYDDEKPQHKRHLPDYYMAKTPVTNGQYLAFVEKTGQRALGYWKGGKLPKGKENHPVVNVTWHDAVAYCRWLAEVTGKPYGLPSEAEWEKATRGTDGRIYPWGNDWDAKKCNTSEGGKKGTTPVVAYPGGASPYGCLDMSGNVWEWCRTKWQ
ncbi:MAG: SUMF1/EgtB/PvdO family nonheme iron enzyme [Thermoflexales bacterium]|nr:SUMF1/EgtB/PvdO family nonheme iron enzyme [Thermoflexales bacterium]